MVLRQDLVSMAAQMPKSHDSADLIFFRLLLIVFVLFTPIVFLFIQLMLLLAWKERYFLISRVSKYFHKYRPILHNIAFVINIIYFLVLIVSYPTFTILSATSTVTQSDYYIKTWNFSRTAFLFIVYTGITFHLANSITYFIYNIKKTKSWFAKFICTKYPKTRKILRINTTFSNHTKRFKRVIS